MMYKGHCNIAFVNYVNTLCVLEDKQLIKHSCKIHQCYYIITYKTNNITWCHE